MYFRFAVKKIVDIRTKRGHEEIGDLSPRIRKNPPLNFQADSLLNLINWKEAIDEPILTAAISTNELRLFLDSPMKIPEWAHWPNNTQA